MQPPAQIITRLFGRLLTTAAGMRLRRWRVLWRPNIARPGFSDENASVAITVGNTIIAAEPERFGANIEIFDYEPWLVNSLAFNNWTTDSGMEPIILRYKGSATGGSASTIETVAEPTTPPNDIAGDGFFDGAAVRIYRVAAGGVVLLRVSKVARYLASPASGYRIVLTEDGPPVREGDIYFLAAVRDDAPLASLNPRVKALADQDTWRIYPVGGEKRGVEKRRDSHSIAPAHASRTSLRVSITQHIEGGVSQIIVGSPAQSILNAFDQSATYRMELWLRQEGIADGAVSVRLRPYREGVGQTFTVGAGWAKYDFTFSGPHRIGRRDVAALLITFHGPGILWVDDVRLFNVRWSPYALRQELIEQLASYQPGALRIWSGNTNIAWGTTLNNWIAPEGQGMRYWYPRRGAVPGALFSLPTALAVAARVGATPWLIVHISFSEQEWLDLIEYLAGPPTSTYGARRAASGQHGPWTEVFARIRIEFGNETWNTLFQPWTFASGSEYGQFAEHFFAVARTSPYYPAVAQKIDFVLGGWLLAAGPRSYGAHARQASPSSAIVGIVTYLANWPHGPIATRTREDTFQTMLLYPTWIMQQLTNRHTATRALMQKLGYQTTLASPEAGFAYQLPSRKHPINKLDEHFGKSLASGVSLLDALLYNTAQGYGPQAYQSFGIGAQWASHTAWAPDSRPHPVWLALQMRNRYAEGAMIATQVVGGPMVSLPEVLHPSYRIAAQESVPLITAYSFRQDNRYAIFVISRRLSGPTGATLHLPAKPLGATLYTLTGDPRANNLNRMLISIQQHDLPNITQDHEFRMPPGSIYLFVVATSAPLVPGEPTTPC